MAAALGVGAIGGAGAGCNRRSRNNLPRDDRIALRPDGDALSIPSTPSIPSTMPVNLDAACTVVRASYPSPGKAPDPGANLSALAAVSLPVRVPPGGVVTLAVRATGHELTVRGPAAIRPCTLDEPNVVLVADGEVTTEAATENRPGAELLVATPAFVAVIQRATLRIAVRAASVAYASEEGDASLTWLDGSLALKGKMSGARPRFDEPGTLATRCLVQAASAAASSRMLAAINAGDAGVSSPLPASSVAILEVEQAKHAKERGLDCAFAEALALACDVAASDPMPGDAAGCRGGYASLREQIAGAEAPQELPPGMPRDPTDASR